MGHDAIAAKSRALEENFYRGRDQALLEYLRSQSVESEQSLKAGKEKLRIQLAEVAQIDDTEVLDGLIRVGVNAESFAALTLLPLVRVAWADGIIQKPERDAVLQAAEADGIKIDSANYRLLESWLDERPDATLLEAWRDYATAISRELDDASLTAVRRATMDRARRIAAAAGGILSLGKRISENEERALLDLARAFEKRE